jgi:spermidine synthase
MVLAVVIILAIIYFPQKGEVYKLIHPHQTDSTQVIGEGVDAVVVSYHRGGATSDYINGQEHGRFGTEWYYAWVTEAASYAPSLDNVLVIGFGSGTFPSILEKTEGLGKLTVVELSPTLIENQKDIPFYQKLLSDPRLTLVIDDGRRYLLQSDEKYDLILMDPIRTTTSHANNLHSRQFFELASLHLKPGGVFLIGGLNEEKIVPKTIASVFKYARNYELFTMASDTPLNKNNQRQEKIYAGLNERDRTLVAEYVNRNYHGDQDFIFRQAASYPINEEWQPRTEFYLGLRLLERLHFYENRQ